MRTNPTNSELQHQACEALASLALNADIWVKIEAAGGIECIATAMRSHPTTSELQNNPVLLHVFLLDMLTTGSRSRQQEQSGASSLSCAAILPTASYNTKYVRL